MASMRKCIAHPPDWWDAFEKQARKEGMSLSAWIGECCLANIPKTTARKLSTRPPAHRPKVKED